MFRRDRPWKVTLEAPLGNRHSELCHLVERLNCDIGLGALSGQTPPPRLFPEGAFAARRDCFDEFWAIIREGILPLPPAMLGGEGAVPPAL